MESLFKSPVLSDDDDFIRFKRLRNGKSLGSDSLGFESFDELEVLTLGLLVSLERIRFASGNRYFKHKT